MTERGQDPIADVISLLAAPIAGGLRTVEQMRRGIDELFSAIENLNRTLTNLNATTERINALLAEFEEPVRAMIPQLTRTIETADLITQHLDAPVRAAAPNIERVAETLSSPGFAQLPQQMGEFVSQLNQMSRTMNPLVQLAENAGGLFGGLRIPGMGGGSTPATPNPEPQSAAKPTAKKPPTKRPAPKKSTAKKSTAKSSPRSKPHTPPHS